MATLYEVRDITIAVLLVLVARLNLVERKLIEHAHLVLNQHLDFVCQSAALKLYTSQSEIVESVSPYTCLATI